MTAGRGLGPPAVAFCHRRSNGVTVAEGGEILRKAIRIR